MGVQLVGRAGIVTTGGGDDSMGDGIATDCIGDGSAADNVGDGNVAISA